MAGSYNKIILIGNLTRDPEIRYVGSGAAVTKFTLAVNRRTKQSEETDYIDIVAWDKLAETCNTYLKKGASCLIDGRLSIRSYETKEGEKRKATEVICNEMKLLDRAERGAEPARGGDSARTTRAERTSERPARHLEPVPAGGAARDESFDDAALEDELPF